MKKAILGKTYKTVGGWEAKVVWCFTTGTKGFCAIHKPNTAEESVAIYHHEDGKGYAHFSINEPPRYEKPHPADIILED